MPATTTGELIGVGGRRRAALNGVLRHFRSLQTHYATAGRSFGIRIRLYATLQHAHMVAVEALRAARFEPAHSDSALGQVNVVPSQIASLAHPQAVPIDQQADPPIALAVPLAFEGGKEPSHFGLRQVLAHP
jgi:hypothetical protein